MKEHVGFNAVRSDLRMCPCQLEMKKFVCTVAGRVFGDGRTLYEKWNNSLMSASACCHSEHP